MYRKFFGLSRSPFEISPDPRFYFPTPQHNEALANLWHGIERRKGFVVLSGEVGTGKSLLLHSLMDALQRTKIRYAYVFNPRMSPDDFLAYVISDFGLPVNKGRGQQLLDFSRFLIQVHRGGSTAALIIDEAHLLSWDMLEEIRLLTNIETAEQKLLQIVLAGQTELDRRLDKPELRQLKQRIALRCTLAPLTREEIRRYLISRLKLAGATEAENIFLPEAVERIQVYSNGIPRLVHTLCENALMAGYARQSRRISAEIIEEAASDFHLTQPQARAVAKSGAEPESKTLEQSEDNLMVQRLARILRLLDRKHVESRSLQGAKVQ
jgi:general secretion pathway protein A